jgi:hypothetical protein
MNEKAVTLDCLLLSSLLLDPHNRFRRPASIGTFTNYNTTSSGVVFNCRDNSQVQITVLAPDLVRVRASFGKPLPRLDHSWAIAKVNWEQPAWHLKETSTRSP